MSGIDFLEKKVVSLPEAAVIGDAPNLDLGGIEEEVAVGVSIQQEGGVVGLDPAHPHQRHHLEKPAVHI